MLVLIDSSPSLVSLFFLSFFIYKLFAFLQNNYLPFFFYLFNIASLCLVTILLTIANAAICYLNFGRGLKEHLVRDGHPSPNAGTSSVGGRVMEID
jgi:hypothetical protein